MPHLPPTRPPPRPPSPWLSKRTPIMPPPRRNPCLSDSLPLRSRCRAPLNQQQTNDCLQRHLPLSQPIQQLPCPRHAPRPTIPPFAIHGQHPAGTQTHPLPPSFPSPTECTVLASLLVSRQILTHTPFLLIAPRPGPRASLPYYPSSLANCPPPAGSSAAIAPCVACLPAACRLARCAVPAVYTRQPDPLRITAPRFVPSLHIKRAPKAAPPCLWPPACPHAVIAPLEPELWSLQSGGVTGLGGAGRAMRASTSQQ